MISRNQKYLYFGTEVVLAVAAVGLLERTKPKLPIAMLMWRPHVSRTQDASERALILRRRTLPRSSSLRCARLALWSSPPTSPSDLTGLFNNTWTKKASKVAAAGA